MLKNIKKELTDSLKKELFPEHIILSGFRGSVAHGTYVSMNSPDSIDDIDLMGVFMAPVGHYIGINQTRETVEKFIDCWDVVNYEFLHYVRLLLKSNPNVLSLLFLRDEFYLDKHYYGRVLIENKDIFITKDAYFSFKGYAKGQIDKMQKFNREGYMGSRRKALVEKYQFDCKNAAHCIRLLKMCKEFLETGDLKVYRTDDADYLLNIKKGGWTLEEVKEAASDLAEENRIAFEKSDLPRKPNYEKANMLVMEILHSYIAENQYEI